ncbi:efflux RND transporter periplasmic adaptor subunit [Candidatus Sumerlaeota bacterium]|nr:efflux RND transporter periplasmic adaptor subunit [Candidatus Sumerlaeota bacterium]
MFRAFSFAFAITLLSSVATAAGPAAGGPPSEAPPPEVSYLVVESRTVPVSYDFLGVLEASRVAEVRARIEGFVKERTFKEGDVVKEGQVLYRIDPDSFLADVEVAKARVQEAESQVRWAESDVRRLDAVKDIGAASQGDIDKAAAQLDQARANVRRLQADLSKAELELSYTDVKAPSDGIVGTTARDVGALVDSGDKGLLTQVWRVDPIYLNFGVSSRQYMQWKKDVAAGTIITEKDGATSVEIVLQDGTVYPQRGTQNFEDPIIDPTTGMIKVRAEFPNAENKLKPGQFVKVLITGWERPNTITVPQRAVSESPQGASVMIIGEGNKLQPRPVKLGSSLGGGQKFVILSGLEAGERVMVDGYMKFPGTVVKPVLLEEKPKDAPADKGQQANAAPATKD